MILMDWEIKSKIYQGRISSFGSTINENISLLSYVYDVFIIVKATISNCLELLNSFKKFKDWTGLQINLSKSSFMVSPSLDLAQKKNIEECLKFQAITTWWKHLGIRMNGRCLPSDAFNSHINKINFQLTGWRAKLLSMAGKVTLLRSTIFTIPIYQLVGCLVPLAIIDKIKKLARNFIWSNDDLSK